MAARNRGGGVASEAAVPAPAVDAHAEVVGQAAAGGLLEVEDRDEPACLPEHVVAKQVAMDHAVRGTGAHRGGSGPGGQPLADHGDRVSEGRITRVDEPLIARNEVGMVVDAAAAPVGGGLE